MKTYELMDLLLLVPILLGISIYTSEPVEDADYATMSTLIFILLIVYVFFGVIPRWLSKMKRSGLKNSLSLIITVSGIAVMFALMEILMPGSLENRDSTYLIIIAYVVMMIGFAVIKRWWWKHTDHRIGPEAEHGDIEKE